MAIQKYAPKWLWLRLPDAIDRLFALAGFDEDHAKKWLERFIQDQLNPRNPGPKFRLLNWRYPHRFPWRGWTNDPDIEWLDWKNSTIMAPHALGRRLPHYEPTPIEISADALESFFRITPKIRKPASAKITAKMLRDLVGDYLAAEKKPTKTGCRKKWRAAGYGSRKRKQLDAEYDTQVKARNLSQKPGRRPLP